MESFFLSVWGILSQIPPKIVGAFIVGALGSGAYLTALYFKFIGDSDGNRSIIMQPFKKQDSSGISLKKCFWYSSVGGAIAVIFQFDVPTFVGVQSLILGATWPAIVSQFLSGRMSSPSKQEQQDFEEFMSSIKTDTKSQKTKATEIIKKLRAKK